MLVKCAQCYEWVLHKAQQLDWSEHSAKALVVIGDCEPHPPSYTDQRINWHDELDLLKGMGVKVRTFTDLPQLIARFHECQFKSPLLPLFTPAIAE